MKEFAKKLKEMIVDELDGIVIEEQEIIKMNDEVLHAFVVKKDGVNVAPTMYIDEAFEHYKIGRPIEHIVNDFVDTITASFANMPDADIANGIPKNYESKLGLRLLEAERNKRFLQNVPHKPVEAGLEVVLTIVDGDYQVVVTNSLAESVGANIDDMFAIAISNKLHDASFGEMKDILWGDSKTDLFSMKEVPPTETPMYVLTTTNGVFGAVPFAFCETRRNVARLIGEYYALPSSVHEMICVPVSKGFDVDELGNMVRGANGSVVKPSDILSDHVYRVDMKGKIEVVA